ncbi:small membrane protein [Klebsiella pneumoniae]|nr:small membrane protein [Klebsiella pneumoniae]WMC38409.1 small membrane protein [Klebsiella pneumoniae]
MSKLVASPLAVSVYFLISYLKDRKKTKLTFNKRKW